MNKRSIPSLDSLEKWLRAKEPYICHYSGKRLGWNIEIDHGVCLSRQGSFALKNLVIASKEMNSCKGNLNRDEFEALLRLISKWDPVGRDSLINKLKQSASIFRKR